MTSTSGAVIIGGIGAALGAIGAAAVTSLGGKSESRAHAADLVVNAAGGLVDRMTARDDRLDKENKALRHALVGILDVIDQLGVNPADIMNQGMWDRLKVASHAAREAM